MSVPAWTIQHDPTIWGDPEVFRPERWLEGKDLKSYLMTFGKGPRACVSPPYSPSVSCSMPLSVIAQLGRKYVDLQTVNSPLADMTYSLAYMEMRLVLATVILRYNIRLQTETLVTTEGFMHKPVNMMVKFSRR